MRRFNGIVLAAALLATFTAFAAEEAKAPEADEATIALVKFDKLPLEDSGPLKLAVKQKDPKLAEGRFGKALDCRGEGIAFIPIPADKAPVKAMTLECWMFIEDFGAGGLPWPVGRNSLHGVYIRRAGKGMALRYYLRLKPKAWKGLTFKVPTKEWFHVAVTFDGKEMKGYVNGKLVAKGKAEGELRNGGAQLFFGTSDHKGNNRFIGLVDEVRYSNIARTEFPAAKAK